MGLLGSLFGSWSARKEQKRARSYALEDYARGREDYVKDRADERAYSEKRQADDRAYLEGQRAEDRAYNERLTASDRVYAEEKAARDRKIQAEMTAEERAYSEKRQAEDRAYAASLRDDDRAYFASLRDEERRYLASKTAEDRAYALKMAKEDRARFEADRLKWQAEADKRAEKSAASAGIDFARLRDEATKAGFNPLTALMAGLGGNYDRRVNYETIGGTNTATPAPGSFVSQSSYGGGSSYSGGSSYAGGGQSAVIAPTIASNASNGAAFLAGGASYSSPGFGYSGSSTPMISSSGFVAEAVDSAIDTLFNRPAARSDRVVNQIREVMAEEQAIRDTLSRWPGRDFGFDLTRVQPFQPAVTSRVPPLRQRGADAVTASRAADRIAATTTGKPKAPDIWFGGPKATTNPGYTSGQDLENEYSEWANVLLIPKVTNDFGDFVADYISDNTGYDPRNVGRRWKAAREAERAKPKRNPRPMVRPERNPAINRYGAWAYVPDFMK